MAQPRPLQVLRAHPYVADGLLATFMAAVQVAIHLSNDQHTYPRSQPSFVGAVVAGLIALTLVWRRRFPLGVLLTVCGALAIVETSLTNTGGWLTAIIAVYSVGAHTRGSRRTLTIVGTAAVIIVLFFVGWGRDTVGYSDLVSTVILFTVAFVIGDNLQRRRQAVADLAERAERAERERDLLARERVQAERTRIARELHDVVAHSLSVMVIQAGAARRQLDRREHPQQAMRALTNIEATGREAMNEMRRVLGVLRSDAPDEGDDAELEPQPSLDDIGALIAASPDVPVLLRTEGPLDHLPAGIEVSVYRVVQEALTNVRRHAGGVSRVEVLLRRDASDLTVEVNDDGYGAPLGPHESGYGLVGMRERVAAFGGDLLVGPRPGGGWRVRARFPAVAP